MMNKKEVATICTMIRKATNAWRNESDDEFYETIGVWYECLKDEPFEFAKKALNEYLRSNQYPPTVADIYRPYKEYLEQQEVLKREYNNIYYAAIANYPAYKDSREERIEFDRITKNSVGKATRLANKIFSFVREQEKGRCEFPSLEEWLKGIDSIE